MSIHADQLFLQAEIDRRLELFGVGDQLHHTSPVRRHQGRLGQLVDRTLGALRPTRPTVGATGRPRHP